EHRFAAASAEIHAGYGLDVVEDDVELALEAGEVAVDRGRDLIGLDDATRGAHGVHHRVGVSRVFPFEELFVVGTGWPEVAGVEDMERLPVEPGGTGSVFRH